MHLPERRAATATAITVAVVATVAGVAASVWVAVAAGTSLPATAVGEAPVAGFAVVGIVIAAARPSNIIGWFLLAGGAAWSLGGGAFDLAHYTIVTSPGALPAGSALVLAGMICRSIGWYLITLAVPIYFPDGRISRSRFAWLRLALVVVVVASAVDVLTDRQADTAGLGSWHNPLAPPGPLQLISGVAFLAHIPFSFVLTGVAVWQLVDRWRRGDAFTRQQVVLFGVAAALPPLAIVASFGIGRDVGAWAFDLTALPLPVAIGFAVLAHGLYDLRSAVNRSLVWLTLSGTVVAVYALVIAAASAAAHADSRAGWVTWVAAGVVAVLLAPLRDILQRAVNRLTFGRWDEPYDVLAALGQRVEASGDVAGLLDNVVAELSGLGLRDVAIVDVDGSLVAGSAETGPAAVETRTLSAYGERVGTLRFRVVTVLRDRDQRLLDDLAGHLGGLLHAQRLTSDVQRARERLVLGREEERRRLRRDLHDGLGPALAGHLLRLDVLAQHVSRTSTAGAEIDRLRDDLRSTVHEVRRVVEGLRPPALDELGLIGALEQAGQRLTSGSRTRVTFTVDRLPQLSAAVEVAVYRIVTEAITNVIRHAEADTCRVALSFNGGLLRVVVADDGRGLRSGVAARGHGLQTMRERAEELRGRLRVTSDGDGTTVTADLPVPPVQAAAPPAAAIVEPVLG